jgi:hypothetical protein
MTPERAHDLLNQKRLSTLDAQFMEKMWRRIQNKQEIVGRERVLLGKLYKKIYGVWPFDETTEDVERRNRTARLLLKAFTDAEESGVLEKKEDRTKFLAKASRHLDEEKLEKKDFSYLFFLSKQFAKELEAYLPKSKGPRRD